MTTPAEQYRALVARLEAIERLSEADTEFGDLDAAMVAAAAPQGGSGQAAAPAGSIETIEAPTFNKAYAQAKAKGLKQFKWCGTYAVKDAVKKPQGGSAKRLDVPAEPKRRQFGGENPGLELGPGSGSDLPISA